VTGLAGNYRFALGLWAAGTKQPKDKKMNSISKLAIASLLVGMTAPVLAQDVSGTVSSAVSGAVSTDASGAVSADASAAVSTDASGTVSTDAKGNGGASASASADTYGSLISALQTGATTDLTTINDATTINFVLVSSLKADADAQALDNAISKNAEANAKLQADVAANAALTSKLTAAGYQASQVLAIVAAADGSLTVYIDDRA
jgi:hypothetical protein